MNLSYSVSLLPAAYKKSTTKKKTISSMISSLFLIFYILYSIFKPSSTMSSYHVLNHQDHLAEQILYCYVRFRLGLIFFRPTHSFAFIVCNRINPSALAPPELLCFVM